MQNKYCEFSRSPEGESSFRRLNDRPPFGDLVLPHAEMETVAYLEPHKLGHLLIAGCGYALDGHCVLPSSAADVTPLLLKMINASEAAVDHRATVSKAGLTGATARWGSRTDAELEQIAPPEIRVPAGLELRPIRSGGVDIPPQEYLQTMAVFLIRGFEPEQYLAFYGYFGSKRWQEGTIGTTAARLNRVQRWNQLDGPRRFDADPPAHILFRELLTVLPANKRVYLLSEGVQVTIDNTNHVCLHAPQEINKSIKSLAAAKDALNRYRQAHHLPDEEWGFVAVPFYIRTRR